MRKLFITGALGALTVGVLAWTLPAFPADLGRGAPQPYKAPQAVPYVASWTGFYAGAFFGYGGDFSGTDITDGTTVASLAGAPHGFLGGLRIGADYQTGPLVLGIVASGSLAAFTGDISLSTINIHNTTNGYALVNGRIGLTGLGSHLLPYVTGGLAFTWDKSAFTAPTIDMSVSQTSTGWNAGVGLEVRLGNSPWSLYGETNWIDTGNITLPLGGGVVDQRETKFLVSTIGFNYRF